MNSLIITLCILITAVTAILRAADSSTIMLQRNRVSGYSSSDLTSNQLARRGRPIKKQPAATASAVTYRTSTIKPMSPLYFQKLKIPLYNYNYNTDTGIQAQEEGYLNKAGIYQEVLEVLGSYSYTDNEGNTFQVSYIANEDGFQPKGSHLPTVPPLIEKALQYIAEENEKE